MSDKKDHIFFKSNAVVKPYSPRSFGGTSIRLPKVERKPHGFKLQENFREIIDHQKSVVSEFSEESRRYPVTVEGVKDHNINIQRLASGGIELVNQSIENDKEIAVVSIPEGKELVLENKITQYLSKETKKGEPWNKSLVESISKFKATDLKDLWSDRPDLYPKENDKKHWFEVWLFNNDQDIELFKKLCASSEIYVQEQQLCFPERVVLLIKATLRQLEENPLLVSEIATFRLSRMTAEDFDSLEPTEQGEWSKELLGRLTFRSNSGVYVSLLDTGVNHKHPLLSPLIKDSDVMVENKNFNDASDQEGHGTMMAGCIAYGDLTEALESTSIIEVNYGIESVKVLEKNGGNEDKNHGYTTQNAISISEIANPERNRIFVMPLTATVSEFGRPSSWSSAIDQICFGNEDEEGRLFILPAGNITNVLRRDNASLKYPLDNEETAVLDPGQSWNAITVGAITHKVNLTEETDFTPLANYGCLSPHTTTGASENWDGDMPLKPDIVFEGGNLGSGQLGSFEFDSLDLLTTYHKFTERLFTVFKATSAASALAAQFAAQILSKYPKLWPETVRGIMAHSADWNRGLLQQFGKEFLKRDGKPRKADRGKLAKILRERVGYGEPSLEKALYSFDNSLCLIIEEEFQPYYEDGKNIKSNMLWIDLPWPEEFLMGDISEIDLKLTVTVSYFIEPNPSGQAKGRYTYPSHQLRFDISRPDEDPENFLARVDQNSYKKFKEDGRPVQTVSQDKWLFGVNSRSRGSLHKDIWEGSAADLRGRSRLAIYPAGGWWKDRKNLKKYNSTTRVAIIVSLETIDPKIEVDLYSLVKSKIETMVGVPVMIEA